MREVSSAPDVSALEVPTDAWTDPFWEAAATETLLLPRCAACHRFRWPPGPFCPHCQSQQTEWVNPGGARLYSFTITRTSRESGDAPVFVPALVEFPQADRVRILAALVEAPLEQIRIGADLKLGWVATANVKAPVFTLV